MLVTAYTTESVGLSPHSEELSLINVENVVKPPWQAVALWTGRGGKIPIQTRRGSL